MILFADCVAGWVWFRALVSGLLGVCFVVWCFCSGCLVVLVCWCGAMVAGGWCGCAV